MVCHRDFYCGPPGLTLSVLSQIFKHDCNWPPDIIELVVWSVDGAKVDFTRTFTKKYYEEVHALPESSPLPTINHAMNIIDVYNDLHEGPETPLEARDMLLHRAHLQGHFGGMAMFKHLRFNGHYWKSMRSDCLKVFQGCIPCQRFNITQHGFHPTSNILAKLPFDHIAIDLKEFTISNRNNKYMVVIVDICTRFVFLRPIPNKEMGTVADVLFRVFCDVGFPKVIQSDNGAEFVNSVVQELVTLSKIDHRLITAYHPRANGAAERWVRTTSDGIYKLLLGKIDLWCSYVPQVQYFTNMKITNLHNSSPFSLMFARPANYFEDSSQDAREVLGIEDLQKRLNFMARVVYPAIFDKASKGKDEETKRFIKNKLIVTKEFHPGAIVMIKNDLRTSKAEVRNEGPFEVVRRTGGGSYEIKGPDGSLYRRAPSQMKLVYQEPVTVSKPAPDEESIIEMEINKIINHRVIDGKTSYLIHWKKLSSELDQWVSEEDINGLDAIRLYVKSLKSHSKPSKRKRRA